MDFRTWLDERYIHDVAARNATVEQACLKHFDRKKVLNIVDVGSGTGSTFLAMYHKISSDQVWTFLEQDSTLINHSITRIVKHLKQEEFQIEKSNLNIIFKKDGKKITLKTINDTMLNIESVVNLDKVDLVTASAIFDLFSIDQYIQFDKILQQKNVGILSVLNYTDMRFISEDELDRVFIDTYHGHMCRLQHFGSSMGPNCKKEITSYYNTTNRTYISGNSIWTLDTSATIMHSFILEYMDLGINDMPLVPQNFAQWLNNKKSWSKNGALAIEVDHFDYFVKGEYSFVW